MTRLRVNQKETKTTRFKIVQRESCQHPCILKLETSKTEITAFLDDGRKTSIPIDWFNKWGYKSVEPKRLEKYEIWNGRTIFWPEIDAHVGVEVFTDGLKNACCDYH